MPLGAIPSPPGNGLHLGPLFVHAYGLAYVVGIYLAVRLTEHQWTRRGGERSLVGEVALWGVPAGILGGRLYFLATSWDQAPHTWWGPFAVWTGGLGIWGGIAGGTAGGLWALHRRGVAFAPFLDAAAPGILVAQAVGRVGNYFNQELFGGPSSLPWALHIEPAYRPAGYERFSTFQPTFLYELVFDLALAAGLIVLGRTRRLAAGTIFALYVAGYSAFRIFEETLRTDPSHHLLGLRLNFFVATTLALAATAVAVWRASAAARRPLRVAGALAVVGGLAILASGCAGHSL